MQSADALERIKTKADQAGNDRPAISIVRRNLKGMEKSYIWQAACLNCEGRRPIQALRQPWMNFKEGRNALAAVLHKNPAKLQFLAVRGARSYEMTAAEVEFLTEPIPEEDPEDTADDVDPNRWRSTF